jgi:hypothetical protein
MSERVLTVLLCPCSKIAAGWRIEQDCNASYRTLSTQWHALQKRYVQRQYCRLACRSRCAGAWSRSGVSPCIAAAADAQPIAQQDPVRPVCGARAAIRSDTGAPQRVR